MFKEKTLPEGRTIKGLVKEFEDKCRLGHRKMKMGYLPVYFGDITAYREDCSGDLPIIPIYFGVREYGNEVSLIESPLKTMTLTKKAHLVNLDHVKVIVQRCDRLEELKKGYWWFPQWFIFEGDNDYNNMEEWKTWIPDGYLNIQNMPGVKIHRHTILRILNIQNKLEKGLY